MQLIQQYHETILDISSYSNVVSKCGSYPPPNHESKKFKYCMIYIYAKDYLIVQKHDLLLLIIWEHVRSCKSQFLLLSRLAPMNLHRVRLVGPACFDGATQARLGCWGTSAWEATILREFPVLQLEPLFSKEKHVTPATNSKNQPGRKRYPPPKKNTGCLSSMNFKNLQ